MRSTEMVEWGFGLEESCDGFVVRQNNCWFLCLPQDVRKLKEGRVNCEVLF